MSRATSTKRAWLAALLSALVTGLGQLYLGRWRRALGWIVVLFGTSALFVDTAAMEGLTNWTAVDPLSVAPILVVGTLSVVDAYLLARAHNAISRLTVASDGQLTHCPNCGRELDPELAFCQWCSAEVPEIEGSLPDELAQRDKD